jgi:hypothetical protein
LPARFVTTVTLFIVDDDSGIRHSMPVIFLTGMAGARIAAQRRRPPCACLSQDRIGIAA